MALLTFNPLTTLTLPILLLFSLPIAILACFTTALAISVLLFRVTLIYIDLAFTVLPSYIIGSSSKSQNIKVKQAPTPRARRKRRSSSLSLNAGNITPITSPNSAIGLTRDFEGVGGWRISDEEDGDGLWTQINSRLELPAEHGRRHKRSLTGSEEGMMMNIGKARTQDGYFRVPGPKTERTLSIGTNSSGSSVRSGLSMKGK